MPIFEYRCRSCGGRFEALLAGADPGTPGCPRCGGANAERLLSTFAVRRPAAETPATGSCGSSDCSCRND